MQALFIPLQMHAVRANLLNVVVTTCNMDKQRLKDGNGEDAGITIKNTSLLLDCFCIVLYYSDNLRFGLQFSRKFVDGSEPAPPNNFKTTKQKRIWSNRLKMNLHNNEVGRQVRSPVVIALNII